MPPPTPPARGDIAVTAALSRYGNTPKNPSIGFHDTVRDARFEYSIRDGDVLVSSIDSPQETAKLGHEKLTYSRMRGLLVVGNRLIVFSDIDLHEQGTCIVGYDCVPWGSDGASLIEIYDVTHPKRPQRVRSLKLSGGLLAVRLTGNTLHGVFSQGDPSNKNYDRWPMGLEGCGTNPEMVEGQFRHLINRLEAQGPKPLPSRPLVLENSRRIWGPRRIFAPSTWGPVYTSIMSVELTQDDSALSLLSIKSTPSYVHVSDDAVYFAELRRRGSADQIWLSHYPQIGEATVIHKFHLAERPEQTKYRSVGLVPGYLIGVTAMQEVKGELQTTTNLYDARKPKSVIEISRLRETQSRVLVRVAVRSP